MSQTPIAVIGLAARLPCADDAEAYWRNLLDGRDCVSAIPPERWDYAALAAGVPADAGLVYRATAGAALDADCYDAAFFGIRDEEALRMDPQQGTMLEMAWHACENAGVVPEALAGREVGVYIGVSTRDFDRRTANVWPQLNVNIATGSCGAIVANRLSYVLGLTGPSMAIDTACASSLTAIHQACRALDDGECALAFAGGVQLILSPTNMLAFARDRVLSAGGGSKPFSAHADGYVFGDGAGMLLLKPLSEALRDGDPIRAVIRGSAVNHNGRSNGLSAPYGAALQQVMRKALARAGLAASDIDYVEAHAVGTPIGDAIEMQAIGRVYGTGRDGAPACQVGSVKGNIGHLEAASGVAAVIKAVLAVERGQLPASLHCQPPSPLIRLDPDALRVCDATSIWSSPAGARPRRAAVSAFGFGGANAHLILEQGPPATENVDGDTAGPWLLMLSARDGVAFTQLCARYGAALAAHRDAGAPLTVLRDFCRATALRRQHHKLRRAILVGNWDQAVGALAELRPAPSADRRCRLGVDVDVAEFADHAGFSDDGELADGCAPGAPARSTAEYPLAEVLRRLGIARVWLDGAGDPARRQRLSAHLAAAGMPAAVYEAGAAPFDDCLILGEAGAAHIDWRLADSWPSRRGHLLAHLFEHGFTLDQQGMAALFEGASCALPEYPFQRRRQHRLHDAIAHAAPPSPTN